MPIVTTMSTDVLFPHEHVRLENSTLEEIRTFISDLKREFDETNDFARTLRLAAEEANAVLAEHPGMGCAKGSCHDRAPLIVHDAVSLLSSRSAFEKALNGDDAWEAGVRGYYFGLNHARLKARRHERAASTGVKQGRGASRGGKARAQRIAETRDFDDIERRITEYMTRNPGSSRAAAIARIAPEVGGMKPDSLRHWLDRQIKKKSGHREPQS